MNTTATIGLGIDAGGTQTRWALATTEGVIVAEGAVGGLSGLQIRDDRGRQHIREILLAIAAATRAHPPTHLCAGVTGLDANDTVLASLAAEAFGVDQGVVRLSNDIEVACRALFAPGEGYVVYAGTGSIAAFIDEAGAFHRAGGRGVLLDDAGGGYWIAREAMRHIWRIEDERPGSFRASALALAVFAELGGDDWSVSRNFFYGHERGEIGQLARVVANVADDDEAAASILREAGRELARLGNAMLMRFGTRPIALTGRAAQLHPLIAATARACLPAHTKIDIKTIEAHHAAARIAAGAHPH